MRSVLKIALLLLVLALGVQLIVAANTTLQFWSWRTEDVDAYSQFIASFEAEYSGVQIQFVPYRNTEYNTILSTSLQAGAGPDILQLRSYGGMEALANAGYLVPLDDRVEALQGFDPYVLLGSTDRRDGHIYGVPVALSTIQVLYNVDIFDKLGLHEPETWADFLATAQALKDAGYTPFANGTKDPWTLETFFGVVAPNFYGGTEFYNDVVAGKVTFEDPRFKAGIEKMLELRPYLPKNYMGIGYTDMQSMFAYGMAGMWLAGSYELGTMAKMNPDLKIGVFPVPPLHKGDPIYLTFYVDGSYAVNAAGLHQEEALNFIKFAATQKFGQMYSNTLKVISAVPGVVPTDPLLAEIVGLKKDYGTPYLMLTAFRYGIPSGSSLLQNELQAVFADQITVDQAIVDIQKGLETWYKPFQH